MSNQTGEKKFKLEHHIVREIRNEDHKLAIQVKRLVRVDLNTNKPVEYAYVRWPSYDKGSITDDGRFSPHIRPLVLKDDNGVVTGIKTVPPDVLISMQAEAETLMAQMVLEDDGRVQEARIRRESRQANQGKQEMRRTGKTDRKRGGPKNGRPEA